MGSATNDLARELGGALGIAVLGSVLQSTYRANLHPDGLPAPLAEAARSSLALASRLGPAVAPQAETAHIDGMRTALTCAAIVVAAAAVAVGVLLRPVAGAVTHPGRAGRRDPRAAGRAVLVVLIGWIRR